jgi:hypothetical protein
MAVFWLVSVVAWEASAFYRARVPKGSPSVKRPFMTFRKALVALAFCAIAPAAAAAEEGRVLEGSYEITFAGFSGFRIDFTARLDGNAYDVESHVFKEGIMKAITMNYSGRNRAWGRFGAQGAQPAGGSLAVVVGREPRTWLAQYGPGGTLQETSTPVWKPEPKDVIPEDKKTGSLDPLTASLAVGMKGDAACEQVAQSNDGRRRIDIILQKMRTETPAQAGLPDQKNDLLVCSIYSRRVAGQFFDVPDEAEAKRDDTMIMWMARLEGTSIRYPARLEAKTGFGTIRGRLLTFKDRPMTAADRAAMQR